MGQKGLFDDFDRELMGKIMAKVTKKLKRSWSDKGEKENDFFDWVTKQNPKTYDSKEAPVLLKEWMSPMKKDIWHSRSLDNRCVSIEVFYLIG